MEKLIEKKSLADEVASRLRKQISTDYYKIGEKLPTEPELMKSFGVGRSTIREAIKILSNLGLLKVQQGVGTFIEQKNSTTEPMDQRLKRANFEDLDEVRQILELKIAEKAAVMKTEQDIQNIRKHLSDRKIAANAGLLKECIDADVNFHIAIAEASKNAILTDLYKSASEHLQKRFIHIYKDTAIFIQTQHLHEQLLKHIIASEPKKAWNIAAKIIARGIE
nr:FadR/GntR family transcriptional regulator [Pedobacter panaciterrae]